MKLFVISKRITNERYVDSKEETTRKLSSMIQWVRKNARSTLWGRKRIKKWITMRY